MLRFSGAEELDRIVDFMSIVRIWGVHVWRVERLILLALFISFMATIVPPRERTCERCGREDVWDDSTENWVVEGATGDPFCLHDWDINGAYNPVRE